MNADKSVILDKTRKENINRRLSGHRSPGQAPMNADNSMRSNLMGKIDK
jgi:hypothetical protein